MRRECQTGKQQLDLSAWVLRSVKYQIRVIHQNVWQIFATIFLPFKSTYTVKTHGGPDVLSDLENRDKNLQRRDI